MTTDTSQGQPARSPLASLGDESGKASRLLVGLIAAPLLALVLYIIFETRHDHDDPIVVDNSILEIRRVKHDPSKKVLSETWSLGNAAKFYAIEVTASYKGGTTHSTGSISAPVDEFEFYTVDTKRPAFIIRRETIVGLFPRAVSDPLESLEFEEVQGAKKLKLKGRDDKHIGQIKFDNQYICVAHGAKPTAEKQPCPNWNTPPDKLTVVIRLRD